MRSNSGIQPRKEVPAQRTTGVPAQRKKRKLLDYRTERVPLNSRTARELLDYRTARGRFNYQTARELFDCRTPREKFAPTKAEGETAEPAGPEKKDCSR